MKKVLFLTLVAAFALALAGCETVKETNSNKAVVINNNANMVNKPANVTANVNTTTGKVTYDKEITREDYDKDKTRYSDDAKAVGSTIGSGAEDGWLWTKTKTALATTADLRDSTIDVDVDNSIVTLRGTVATKAEMEKAVKVAQEVKDVKSVKNMLKVAAADSMSNQMVTDDPGKKPAGNMNK